MFGAAEMLTPGLNINLTGIRSMEKNIYFYSGYKYIDDQVKQHICGIWEYSEDEDGKLKDLMHVIIDSLKNEDNEAFVLTSLNKL